MKILEIIPSLNTIGGAEMLYRFLCLELNKDKDIELYVVLLYDGIDKYVLDDFAKENIQLIYCHKNKGLDYRCSKLLCSIIKKINPDIIHAHLNSLVTLFYSYLKCSTMPHIFYTVHSMAKFDMNFISRILVKIMMKADAISLIAISNIVGDSVFNMFRIRNYHIIYNGTRLFEKGNEFKKYDLINVANFSKVKNQQFLIDTFNILWKDDNSLTMAFAGDGELLEKLKFYSNALDCSKNIFFLGYQTNIKKILNQSRIFVMSSLCEGNPISILEAMSVGLPIISTNVGGIPDVIVNDVNGYLYNIGDKNEFVKKAKKLLYDDTKYNFIQSNNLRDCSQYSISVCAGEYKNLFSRHLNHDK